MLRLEGNLPVGGGRIGSFICRWYYRLDPIAIPLLVRDQQWEDALVLLALRELQVYVLGIACSILDRQRPRPSVKVELWMLGQGEAKLLLSQA